MNRKPLRKKRSGPQGSEPATVGFIGLGSIGLPMVKNIVASGFPLTVVTQANGVITPLMHRHLVGLGGTPGSELSNAKREAFVGLAEKDMAITLELARDVGVPLPATGLCSQLMAEVGGLKERQPRM